MLTICPQILNVWNTNSKLLVKIVQNTLPKLLKTCGILFLNYGVMWNANPKLLEMWNDINEIYKTSTSDHTHSDTRDTSC